MKSGRLYILIVSITAICGTAALTTAAAEETIRRIDGRHLTLFTDVPADKEVDGLVDVFDAAFPEWCAYFEQSPVRHAKWRVTGYLMKSRERFARAGHIPARVPDFRNGFSWNYRLWLYDQTSPYYRRHLLLHEGTHSFMNTVLGGVGPPWYAEGMAELLATHRWEDGKIELAYYPRRVEEVPKLGRVELIQRDVKAGRALKLADVTDFDSQAHAHNEAYGWCWGAAAFLQGTPRYRASFADLRASIGKPSFEEQTEKLLRTGGRDLADQWQIFVTNVDYGYDFARMNVEFSPGKPLAGSEQKVQVSADRGWQATGVRLEANRKYRLTARGRYQIAARPRVWWCEPGGVTITYYHGMPLGILMAAVRPEDAKASQAGSFAKPVAIGLEHVLAPVASGILYLRINDAAGRLGDNKGSLSVRIAAQQ